MFNPFAVFEPHFLQGFRQKGVVAFVQQTYDRGRLPSDARPAFLLTHFDRMDWAREHYDVLQRDPHRKVFLIERPEGMQALRQTLLAKEAVYYTGLLVKDANKKAKKSLEKSIRSYIERETSWRPVRDEEVDFSLEIHFGQLYARLIYGRESVREKLDSLENSWKHVL